MVSAMAADIAAVKAEIIVAEFASHHDCALDVHMVEIVSAEGLQHPGQALARTPAAIGERARQVGGNTLGVKQPE